MQEIGVWDQKLEGVGLRQAGRAAQDTGEATPRASWARQQPSQVTSSQTETERRVQSGRERSTPVSNLRWAED
jgi:hypothetical protein